MKSLTASFLALAFVGLFAPPGTANGDASPGHTEFHDLLVKYVGDGGVRYREWSENASDRAKLRDYLGGMARVSPSKLDRADALAYWINLYNALTLNLVLDHYPVKSIKDIGGMFSSPWKQKLFTVEEKTLTLDEIENDVIRPGFEEPRIHFALNCAARSCPPLRAEAFVGDRLEEQLEEQTVAFLGDPDQNSLGENGRLELSKIFDWYAGDFEKAAGSVGAYVRPYLPSLAERDPSERIAVGHRDYDWSLNEAVE